MLYRHMTLSSSPPTDHRARTKVTEKHPERGTVLKPLVIFVRSCRLFWYFAAGVKPRPQPRDGGTYRGDARKGSDTKRACTTLPLPSCFPVDTFFDVWADPSRWGLTGLFAVARLKKGCVGQGTWGVEREAVSKTSTTLTRPT